MQNDLQYWSRTRLAYDSSDAKGRRLRLTRNMPSVDAVFDRRDVSDELGVVLRAVVTHVASSLNSTCPFRGRHDWPGAAVEEGI